MFESLTRALPAGLQPYAKAAYPALVSLLGMLAFGLIEGEFDKLQLEVGVVGLISTIVTFSVTNAAQGIQKYAKAFVPAALGVAALVVHYVFTGEWNQAEWTLLATGAVTTALALLVPNLSSRPSNPTPPVPPNARLA
jgi:hypothetical protein